MTAAVRRDRHADDGWYRDVCRTWNDVLERNAEKYPQKTILICEGRALTFSEFRDQVHEFAKALLRLHVRKGDVVAIWMPNCIEWVVCQFAAYRVGAVLLSLYSYYRRSELEYALAQAGVHTLISTDRFLGKIDALSVLKELVPEIDHCEPGCIQSEKFPSLRNIVAVDPQQRLRGRFDFSTLLAQEKDPALEAALWKRQTEISPFDVMNIMYTSGTTGFPKAGMSMHITNLSTITHWTQEARLGPDDVILCHVPIFTNFGGLYGVCLGIYSAAKVVITRQFSAAESLRLIEKEGVTYVPGTPSMFRIMIDDPAFAGSDRSSVRAGHVAGAPLSASLMQEIINDFGVPEIMQAWGLSECGGLSTVTTCRDPMEKRLDSVGKALPSAIVRVVGPGSLQAQPAETPGEIVLRDVFPGSCVGKGYYGAPEKTAATITPEGWFRTGDMGFFDAEGYLHLVGRVDDMFTVGGFNIYPAEIENKLCSLTGVKEAFVVPAEDRRLGAVPVAWVAADPEVTEAAIVEFCAREVASQKVPRRVIFYQPGELPMTPSGKVRKKELIKLTAERLASERAPT